MPEIRLSQFGILLTGIGMTAIGILGFTNNLTQRAQLIALILVAVSFLSFHVGQTYSHTQHL